MPAPTNFMPDGVWQTPDLGAEFTNALQKSLLMQAQQAQAQRQATQQQQLDAARQSFIAAPTAQNVRALAALDPQGFTAIKEAHSQESDDQQRQSLRDTSAVLGLVEAGRKDDALAVLQKRIDASKKAGADPSAEQHIADLIASDPKAAIGVLHYGLAAIMGPDKWAEAYGKIGSEARDNAAEPGKEALTAAQTDQATAAAAKSRVDAEVALHPPAETAVASQLDANGNPILYNPKAAPPANYGSPDMTTFVGKLQMDESGGVPDVKNPRSTATGTGQFTNGTWLQTVRASRPDLAAGRSDAEILAMRKDPALSGQITAAYAQANAQTLATSKLPVNGATLAMAHKLGPGGAQAVLNAQPDAQLSTILPKEVMAANPQLKNLTAGQYAQGLAQKFGTAPMQVGAPDPGLTGQEYLATLPPGRARLVQAIANGDQAAPTGRSMTSGAGQAIMAQVLQYDPTASAMNLETRKKTREAFTSGPEGRAINSANTVVGHLSSLSTAIDNLHNTGLDWVNGPAQFAGRKLGNKDTQSAVGRFNFYKTAVANELTKVFRGSNGAEADVQGWIKQLDSAKSPTELHATVDSMIDGMKSRLEALGFQYSQGMGKSVQPMELLSPHARQQLAKLESGGAGAATPPAKAVQMLQQNPALAAQFDQKYGAGAAARYAGGR